MTTVHTTPVIKPVIEGILKTYPKRAIYEMSDNMLKSNVIPGKKEAETCCLYNVIIWQLLRL